MHEMGHALGLGDSYDAGDRDDLMYGWLFTGERRLPGAGEADGAVAGSITSEEFLGAPIDIGVLPAGKTVTIQWQATIDPQTNQLIVNPVEHRHGLGHQRGRLPRHQHQHRHHHARHADRSAAPSGTTTAPAAASPATASRTAPSRASTA